MIMPFGRYRGKPLHEVPESYLNWMLQNCENITPQLRREVRSILFPTKARRRPAPQLPGQLVNDWYRRLAKEFHPDARGNHEAMVAVNRGRELLLELAGGDK